VRVALSHAAASTAISTAIEMQTAGRSRGMNHLSVAMIDSLGYLAVLANVVQAFGERPPKGISKKRAGSG